MTNLSFWQRSAILIGLLMVGLLALLALDPIPQDPNYHLFADNRSLFGIPHFNNVISNAGFAVVGIVGFLAFAGVAREVRSWEKTSDHAPAWVELEDIAPIRFRKKARD